MAFLTVGCSGPTTDTPPEPPPARRALTSAGGGRTEEPAPRVLPLPTSTPPAPAPVSPPVRHPMPVSPRLPEPTTYPAAPFSPPRHPRPLTATSRAVSAPVPVPRQPAPVQSPLLEPPPSPSALPTSLPQEEPPPAAGEPSAPMEKPAPSPTTPEPPPGETRGPVLLSQEELAYPAPALEAGWQGTVTLELWLDQDGRVERAEVASSSGHPILDQAGLQQAGKWRFQPALQGGRAVPSHVTRRLHYRIDPSQD